MNKDHDPLSIKSPIDKTADHDLWKEGIKRGNPQQGGDKYVVERPGKFGHHC